jgi:hypothetical protein
MLDAAHKFCGDFERGVLGMKVRRTGLATVGVALSLAALVAVIGAAQAAPSNKKYSATAHVTGGQVAPKLAPTSATLKLTLTNETRSQTLGSANFSPPEGVTFPVTGTVPDDRDGWTATIQDGLVAFRSTSSPLRAGDSVSADVQVNINRTSCMDATWTTRAKQSNDFSGNPGNDFTLNPDNSNLRPLGSFVFEPVGTDVPEENPVVFAPQLKTGLEATVEVTAFDLCGANLPGYGSNFGDAWDFGPSAEVPPTPRLDGANLTDIDWEATGDGSATMTPIVVETGDVLVITDDVSDIDASSNEFDVVETICTSLDKTCHWQDRPNNPRILADAPAPPPAEGTAPDPSLGIGFNSDLSFDCEGDTSPVGGTLININPRDYPAGSTIEITLTYKNSVIGGGPASSFSLCLSKDNGETWADEPVSACPLSADDIACILDQRKSGGDLVIVLLVRAQDPWGGLS